MTERNAILFHLTADQILEAVKAHFPGVPADATLEAMQPNVSTRTLEVVLLHWSFPPVAAYADAAEFGRSPHRWEVAKRWMKPQEGKPE